MNNTQETKLQNSEAVETPEEQQKKKVPGVPFTKDDPRINRKGRPQGTRDFSTDFDEAVEEIAQVNNITKSQARKILLKKAYAEAKNGKFPFYKDIMDRYYGEPEKNINLNIDAESKERAREAIQEAVQD